MYGSSFKGQKISKADYNRHVRSRLHRNLEGSKADEASISLEFDYARVGYIDSFIVKRSWKYIDSAIMETLDIQENNKPLTEVNEEQWQNFLMELIPPSLSKLFFFDGEKIQTLARGQGENQHIIGSINSLLGIDLIERLKYDIKLYRSKELSDNGKDFEAKVAEITNRKESIESQLDFALQNKASLQSKIMRVNLEIENQELRISTEGGGFASKREQLKQEAKTLEVKIESKKEQIRSICTELLPFAYVPELCRALKNRLEYEEKEQQRQATLTYLSVATNELTKDIGDTLTLDSIKLSKEDKQLVASEAIKVLRNKIEKMNGACKENIHAVSKVERHELLGWIETVLRHVPTELKELSLTLVSLKSEYETTQKYIFNAPADDVLRPLFIKLGELHEELGRLQQQHDNLEKESESLRRQLEIVKREYDGILDEKIQFEKSNRRMELAARTQDVIEEYLQRLRNEKIAEFRENFLECFNLLFGKENLISDVKVNEANFDITLITPQGIPISKTEFSAGERQIYAMAMIWALAKTSGRPLPFIIDTPLGRLDIEHRNNILKNFLVNASHQMIVFSTNTEIDQNWFDQLQPYIAKAYTLEYKAEKGETTVKEGYFWKLEVQ